MRHKKFNIHKWYGVETTVNAAAGIARMAVSQPLGSRFVPVLDFKNKAAGKVGPIAFQMHNKGLFDQYRNVDVEVIPTPPTHIKGLHAGLTPIFRLLCMELAHVRQRVQIRISLI